ncbi:hypothetical protein Tco_0201145 [Tanacetum coccineum]
MNKQKNSIKHGANLNNSVEGSSTLFLTEMQEVVLFLTMDWMFQLDTFLDSRGVIPIKETVVDVKEVNPRNGQYSSKIAQWKHHGPEYTETSDGLAAIQAQLDNLGR